MANPSPDVLCNAHLTAVETFIVAAFRLMRDAYGAEVADRATESLTRASFKQPPVPKPPKYYPLTVLNDPSLELEEKSLVFAYWGLRDKFGEAVAGQYLGEFIQGAVQALVPPPDVRLVSSTARPPARRRPSRRGQVSIRLVKGGAR